MAKEYDGNITGWITMGGKRIPIRKGESKADAVSKAKGEGKKNITKPSKKRAFFYSSKEGQSYADYKTDKERDEGVAKLTTKKRSHLMNRDIPRKLKSASKKDSLAKEERDIARAEVFDTSGAFAKAGIKKDRPKGRSREEIEKDLIKKGIIG